MTEVNLPPNLRPSRRAQPSRAVTMGGTAGTSLSVLIMWGLAQFGVVLPPEVAAAAAASITAAIAWFARGGRKGEAD